MTVSDERLMELIAAIEAEWGVDMPDEGEWIADEIAALRELQAARRVLAKLPKTADGVTAVDGDKVYSIGGRELEVRTEAWRDECVEPETNSWEPIESTSIRLCYSTRAATDAAMAEEKNDD